MEQGLLIALLAGLGGMLGWGFADFFAKKTIDQIGYIVSLAWAHIFGTLIFAGVVFYRFIFGGHQIIVPSNLGTWSLLIFFGILQAAVYFFVYKGFGKGQVSILDPIFASFSGLTAILSIVVFGEIISGHLVVALVIIFCGVLLINVDFQALRLKRFNFVKVGGFREVAIATLLAALWTLFWSKFIEDQDWASYALWMYLFMTLAILVIVKFQKINLLVVKRGIWKFLILIGLCETIAYLSISLGYSVTSRTSIIALLSGAFSLPTIILARVFLKEKVTKIQTIGSIVIIAGIVFLSLI